MIAILLAFSLAPAPAETTSQQRVEAMTDDVRQRVQTTLLRMEEQLRERALRQIELERIEADLNAQLKKNGQPPVDLSGRGRSAAELFRQADDVRRRREALLQTLKPPAPKPVPLKPTG